MYCPKCGAQTADGAAFCPSCGQRIPDPSQGYTPSATDGLKKLFTSPLFLAICILLTVTVGAKLMVRTLDIHILLIIIGIWLVYTGAKNYNNRQLSAGVTVVSVSVKIVYVALFVCAGFLFACGLMLFALFSALSEDIAELFVRCYETVVDLLEENHITFEVSEEIHELMEKLLPILGELSGTLIGSVSLVFFAVTGGLVILFNILFLGCFSKFLTNASRALKEDKPFDLHDKKVAVRILICGIFTAIAALSKFATYPSLLFGIAEGCVAAACIVSYIFMKKEEV